jgi:phage-related protein
MRVLIYPLAKRELAKFDHCTIQRFRALFNLLAGDEKVTEKLFKKLSGIKKLYELRVKSKSGIYRGIGSYVKPGLVIVLFVQKKQQKLQKKTIRLAKLRLDNVYNDINSLTIYTDEAEIN